MVVPGRAERIVLRKILVSETSEPGAVMLRGAVQVLTYHVPLENQRVMMAYVMTNAVPDIDGKAYYVLVHIQREVQY